MDKLLDTYSLPKLNQEDIINLNRSIMNNEIEVLRISQQTKDQEWADSLINSTRLFKTNFHQWSSNYYIK
jgi:hypothetical protein